MYYEKTKDRDLAIVTLLLGTGIRVSTECVGLDVEDVDFKNNGIKRSHEKVEMRWSFYFGPEVEKAPEKYLEVRENIAHLWPAAILHCYSTQRRRIGASRLSRIW